MPNHPSDPRTDIQNDHRHWELLLHNCWHLENEMYFLLQGIRCGGAEVMTTQESFRLLPGGWSESEWEDIKQNRLSQYRDKLIEIFRLTRLGRATDAEIPKQFADSANRQTFANLTEQIGMFGAGK